MLFGFLFSLAAFSQTVSLITPNGGETWTAGSNQYIYWDQSGLTTVKLEYSTNNGASWQTIAASVAAATEYYNWSVPSTSTTYAKVRISSTTNPSITDISNNVFSIITPSVTVTSPNGGEVWTAGSSKYIYWSGQGMSNYVAISYSTDGGTTWTSITSSSYNNGYYNWTIPSGINSSNCKIKVSDSDNSTITDISDATFTINLATSSITVSTPNGGENWYAGANKYIYWNSTGVSTVDISYSTDNGNNWNTIATGVNASNGYYYWTVANAPSTLAKIKITDAASASNYDVSDNVFTIQAPSVTLTTPNGGEIWTAGSYQYIYYTANGLSSYVTLEYSTDGGTSWTTIVSGASNSGSYYWQVPSVTSSNCKIRVTDYTTGSLTDMSDGVFSITPSVPSITLSTPNGGENWSVGSSQYIYWSSSNSSQVNLYYSTNNGSTWTTIASNVTASQGYYYWTIPNAPSTLCKVKIADANNSAYFDVSDNIFTISTPAIVVTSPNGGEVFQGMTYRTIYWASNGLSNYVNLDYSTDNGSTWNTITTYASNSGTYNNWYVPNVSSNNCKIRVTDSYNNLLSDESNAVFTINPTPAYYTITSPNGGELWATGSAQYIYWSSTNPGMVKLEYSTDNGATWNLIVSNINGSSNSYYWSSIPSTVSNQVKIKITDLANASYTDQSDAVFSFVAPYVKVTEPNGGEVFQAGNFRYIYWNTAGASSYVKIEYTTDGGSNWITQINPASNTGSYYWQVPNVQSTACKVRITDYYTGTIVDQSDNNFTIGSSSAAYVQVTAPNGNDVFTSGSNQYIQWNSSGITTYKLEYSTDGGATYTLITNSATGTYYLWNVPNTPSTTCRVRISDAATGNIKDVSNNNFTIQGPSVTVTTPNGGEVWTANSYQYIYWTGVGLSSYVTIEYSTDGGSNWTTVANCTYNNQYYYWYVPNTPSTSCLIRVKDCYTASISDVSNAVFTIAAPVPQITVTYPNGGNTLYAGGSYNITWNSSYVNTVKIDYSTDNGVNWTNITNGTSASSGSYAWSIPGAVNSTTCRIRVSDSSNVSYMDMSNTAFSILQPGYTITSPNGGEVLTGSSNKTIYWSGSTPGNYVSLSYSLDSGATWTSITNYTYNYNSYSWTVPNISTNDALVRVVDYSDTTKRDVSDAVFTINPAQGSLTVTTPNGGQSYLAGSSQYIYWNYSNVQNVKVEYTTDNGATWNTIVASTPASNGYYYWNPLPNISSTTCKVRVTDVLNSSVTDQSNNTFTIYQPYLIVTTPNGGESWTAGTSKTIYWTGLISSSYVKLDYSADNGATWNPISSSYYNYGYYTWTVPNNPSTQCLIRVQDYADTTVKDISDATFTITAPVPSITVSTPNGGQTYYTGTSQYIYWSSSNVQNVKLEYSTNNGTSWNTIIASTAASTGYYQWTIPTASSTMCKVRVSDATSSSISDVSDNVFTIQAPSIVLTTPNGGEIWPGGTSQTIYWSTLGNTSYVNIYYSTDNGATYNTVASCTYNNGYYYWSVPNTPSSTCRIRVIDCYNSAVGDTSDFTFTISSSNPTITVTSPNGGETWGASGNQYITWSSFNVANVKIEYSANNGSTWSTVSASTPASNSSYYWNVPATTTTTGLIRVSDVTNSSINDVSNNTFSIVTPTITVQNPDGGENITGLSNFAIEWYSQGASNYVNIQYSIDNGTTWNTIVTGTNNDGDYTWSVPNTPSNLCKIKITDYYNASVTDQSNNVFTINAAPASITVTSPNGGETWTAGGSYYIYWNSTSVNYVKLEYTLNNGASWTTINSSYNASLGYYNWIIPSTPSVNCRLRISDAGNPSVSDQSNSVFSIIVPQLSLTSPNGGQSYTGFSTQTITWTGTSVSNYVTLEYSTNNGSSWYTITSGIYNSGSYSWTVPNTPSTTCLVRVKDYYNSSVFDVSDATFTITAAPASIVVYDPNGGEVFGSGTSQYITWGSSGVTDVKIEYSVNGGASYTTIIASTAASSGYYYWPIPNNPSSNCKIRISDVSNSSVNDVSDAVFTITTPAITVTSPNGGEVFTGNTYEYITWNTSGLSSYVKLEYTTNNGSTWNLISNGAYNSGSYNWYVPNVSSSTVKVRVTDYYLTTATDESNNTFTINQAPASIIVTSPNGGEEWAATSQHYITWNSSSVSAFKIEYSTNGGASWNTIVASTSNNGSYLWTLPNTVSTTCLVRVSDASNSAIFDQSNYVFSISNPSITVTTPNGGENLQIGNSYYIQWNSLGVNNVKIEYTTNNSTWTTIVNNYPNYGYYYWSVPNAPSSTCRVRVTSTTSQSVTDVSNNNFSIIQPVPSLALNSPNGGEVWYVGYQYYITWTANAVQNVKLEFSTNNGTTWNTIIASTPASSGFYYWPVPNAPSSNCRIRISNAANGQLNDVSNNVFTIATPVPSLTVNSPNGGESWYGNTYHYISWTPNFVNAVDLAYSTDNGTTWTTIATNVTGSYYYWYVPNDPSTNCLVKATSSSNQSLSDVSNAVFSILAPVVNTNTISTDSISPLPFCKEDSIKVYYTATGTYNSGNYFLVQLSDSSGSFTNPTIIGSRNSTGLTGYIDAYVPAHILNGTQYRIRVVSDNLPATGSANPQNIRINSPEFDFAADETIKYLPDGMTEFTFLGDTANISSYEWSFGDGSTSTQVNPMHNYSTIVYHDVTLKVTNDLGCAITVNKPSYMRVEQVLPTSVLNSGTTVDITGLAFSNDLTGCIALSNGTCLFTADSGATWATSVTGMNGAINGVWWVPGYGVFAVGANGNIYYSTNSGATWNPFVTGTTESFNATAFSSSTNGYAVGTNGVIYQYNGTTWTPRSSGVSVPLNAVYAVSSTVAVALGDNGTIVRTVDGGTNWTPVTAPVTFDVRSVGFAKSVPLKGYAAGSNGTLLSTADGGATWSVSLSGVDVDFTSVTSTMHGDTAWAVSNSGVIYKTENGGTTWVRYSKGSTNDNTGVTYRMSRGYITGKGGDLKTFQGGIDTTTAIRKIVADVAGFRFYPNPANEQITIESELADSDIIQVSVKDINGRLVAAPAEERVNREYRKVISVSTLAPGTYFIHVTKGNTSFVQKLVVVH